MAPRVFQAPEGPAVGPGRCVCRWAAARWAGLLYVPMGGGPPARRPRREPSARRVASKPGQAPPPPTGTAARPHHRPRAPQPGPSSSSGALHTSGAWSLIGASSRSPARPRAPAAEPTPNFACNSVVTLKPTAPLLTTFGRFERVSRSQRRCRFHSAAHIRSQRCHRFHSDGLRCPRTRHNSPSTARIHPRTRQNSPSTLKTAKNERCLASRANFFTEVPPKGQRWANFVSAQAGTDLLGP